MLGLIISIIVLAAVLMILIVLVQKSKGGGLASSFSSSNQIMGVRKTTDFLEKFTWALAIIIMVLCVFTAKYSNAKSNTGTASDIQIQTDLPATNNPVNNPLSNSNKSSNTTPLNIKLDSTK